MQIALGLDSNEEINEAHLPQIDALRSSKPQWMITTYRHKPLVGVTKIIQPNGVVANYEYDDFNRLEFIKDSNGNLVEDYKYNYVPSPDPITITPEEKSTKKYYKIRRCNDSNIEVWTQAYPDGTFNSGDRVEGGSGVYYVVVGSQEALPQGYLYSVSSTNASGCGYY